MSPEKSALTAYVNKVLVFLGAALCVIAVVLWLSTRAATQTHRVVCRLHVDGGPVTQAQLQRAEEVLSARLEALGRELELGRGGVRVLPPDRIELRFNCRAGSLVPLAWLTLEGRVEFRLLHPDGGILEKLAGSDLPPQYEVKVYRKKQYTFTRLNELKTVEEPFAVEREPMLAVRELKDVTFEAVGPKKRVLLTVHLREEDAETFGRLTALHAGRRMAMLVDGEMFFPPKEIESAITGGVVQAQGFFYIPPVRRLAKVLGCGSLPGRLEVVSEEVGGAD